MNVAGQISGDSYTHGGGERPPCTELTLDALPEVQKSVLTENSQIGVSTRNILSGTADKPCVDPKKPKEVSYWYALRVTYGREKKAYEYLLSKNVDAYYPTITIVKVIDGKRRFVEKSRLPNIFFARGTEAEIKSYVYDNQNLPYLRFYYKHTHVGSRIIKEPMIIPDSQIRTLKIICAADENNDILISHENIQKFQVGETVRVIDGKFKGVEGQVARYQGQQRVGIVINGLLTVATAYIPTAFLEKTESPA